MKRKNIQILNSLIQKFSNLNNKVKLYYRDFYISNISYFYLSQIIKLKMFKIDYFLSVYFLFILAIIRAFVTYLMIRFLWNSKKNSWDSKCDNSEDLD